MFVHVSMDTAATSYLYLQTNIQWQQYADYTNRDFTVVMMLIVNSSSESIDTWFTAEIEAEIHNFSCDLIVTCPMYAGIAAGLTIVVALTVCLQ